MINENGYIWSLNLASDLTVVKVNGKDLSNYLAEGSSIGWYDVSKNSGREVSNANGDMILNVVNEKFRLDLVARALTSEEFVEFFSEIRKKPTMSVEFLNPWTNQTQTINCYRGDRLARPKMPYNSTSFIYTGPTQALIEL